MELNYELQTIRQWICLEYLYWWITKQNLKSNLYRQHNVYFLKSSMCIFVSVHIKVLHFRWSGYVALCNMQFTFFFLRGSKSLGRPNKFAAHNMPVVRCSLKEHRQMDNRCGQLMKRQQTICKQEDPRNEKKGKRQKPRSIPQWRKNSHMSFYQSATHIVEAQLSVTRERKNLRHRRRRVSTQHVSTQ